MNKIKFLTMYLITAILFIISCSGNNQNQLNNSNGEGEITMKANEKYKELLKRDFAISKEDEDLQNIFNNFVYGEVYNHGDLEPKLRELITLVSLTASQGNSIMTMTRIGIKIILNSAFFRFTNVSPSLFYSSVRAATALLSASQNCLYQLSKASSDVYFFISSALDAPLFTASSIASLSSFARSDRLNSSTFLALYPLSKLFVV